MKRFRIALLIAFAATAAFAQAVPETVSVTGTGRANVTPDRFSFVYKQPETPEEEVLCKDAMDNCPVEAIGNDGT